MVNNCSRPAMCSAPTPLGSLQHSPIPPSWIKDRDGKENEGRGEKRWETGRVKEGRKRK